MKHSWSGYRCRVATVTRGSARRNRPSSGIHFFAPVAGPASGTSAGNDLAIRAKSGR